MYLLLPRLRRRCRLWLSCFACVCTPYLCRGLGFGLNLLINRDAAEEVGGRDRGRAGGRRHVILKYLSKLTGSRPTLMAATLILIDRKVKNKTLKFFLVRKDLLPWLVIQFFYDLILRKLRDI